MADLPGSVLQIKLLEVASSALQHVPVTATGCSVPHQLGCPCGLGARVENTAAGTITWKGFKQNENPQKEM